MADWWGRKVARLPDRGVLLVATDLQGNYDDYQRLRALYDAEEAAGREPVLALCGDLVHGPDADTVERWPDHLGTPYRDRSAELILDYERWRHGSRTLALLGNHEHAHVGGPVVRKFHDDEAAVLEAELAEEVDGFRDFVRSFPLVAVGPCGVVLTHAAPRCTEPDLDSFENLEYRGFERVPTNEMHLEGTVGGLLWSRMASPDRARALLTATSLDGHPNAFVAYGHDVVHEGYEKVGAEQICVSTSFGLYDEDKIYLRLDLARRYRSVEDLREGVEILRLYPERAPG
jgi:hypothetical protein